MSLELIDVEIEKINPPCPHSLGTFGLFNVTSYKLKVLKRYA